MKRSILLLLITLIFVPQTWAGWKIVFHQTEDGVQRTITYYIDKDRLRISDRDFLFIYDKVENSIFVVNHNIKSYYHGSLQEYQVQIDDVKLLDNDLVVKTFPKSFVQLFDKQLQKQISDSRYNGSQGIPSIEIKQKRQSARIASYQTNKYEIYYDSSLIQEIWFSDQVRTSDDINLIEVLHLLSGTGNTDLSQGKSLNTQDYNQLLHNGFPLQVKVMNQYGLLVFSQEPISVNELTLDLEEIFTFQNQDYQKLTLVDIIMAQKK